jgi:hypothetical protein
MEFEKERFKRMFPKLAKEIGSSKQKTAINSVRMDAHAGEKAASKDFTHYMPDVIDFIRRCETEKQAEEIVAYMEKRGEIRKQYADRLRKQLREKGVRSFGPKKKEGYYFNRGGL